MQIEIGWMSLKPSPHHPYKSAWADTISEQHSKTLQSTTRRDEYETQRRPTAFRRLVSYRVRVVWSGRLLFDVGRRSCCVCVELCGLWTEVLGCCFLGSDSLCRQSSPSVRVSMNWAPVYCGCVLRRWNWVILRYRNHTNLSFIYSSFVVYCLCVYLFIVW